MEYIQFGDGPIRHLGKTFDRSCVAVVAAAPLLALYGLVVLLQSI